MIDRAAGVLASEVDGTAVLVDPFGRAVIELNAVGSLVWSSIDGTRDLDGLVDAVAAAVSTPVAREQITADVRTFLAALDEHGLLAAR